MDPITLTYDVPVPRAAAFYLFVGEFGQWWPASHSSDPTRHLGASIEPRPTGAVSFHNSSGDVVWGEVLAIDPVEVVSWSCWARGERQAPSVVTVRFFDSEWGTRVVLEHGGWNAANTAARERHRDWPAILAHYVSHARRHARGAALATRQPRGVA